MALALRIDELHGQSAGHGNDAFSFPGAENARLARQQLPERADFLLAVAKADAPQRGELRQILPAGAADHASASSARYFSSRMSGV